MATEIILSKFMYFSLTFVLLLICWGKCESAGKNATLPSCVTVSNTTGSILCCPKTEDENLHMKGKGCITLFPKDSLPLLRGTWRKDSFEKVRLTWDQKVSSLLKLATDRPMACCCKEKIDLILPNIAVTTSGEKTKVIQHSKGYVQPVIVRTCEDSSCSRNWRDIKYDVSCIQNWRTKELYTEDPLYENYMRLSSMKIPVGCICRSVSKKKEIGSGSSRSVSWNDESKLHVGSRDVSWIDKNKLHEGSRDVSWIDKNKLHEGSRDVSWIDKNKLHEGSRDVSWIDKNKLHEGSRDVSWIDKNKLHEGSRNMSWIDENRLKNHIRTTIPVFSSSDDVSGSGRSTSEDVQIGGDSSRINFDSFKYDGINEMNSIAHADPQITEIPPDIATHDYLGDFNKDLDPKDLGESHLSSNSFDHFPQGFYRNITTIDHQVSKNNTTQNEPVVHGKTNRTLSSDFYSGYQVHPNTYEYHQKHDDFYDPLYKTSEEEEEEEKRVPVSVNQEQPALVPSIQLNNLNDLLSLSELKSLNPDGQNEFSFVNHLNNNYFKMVLLHKAFGQMTTRDILEIIFNKVEKNERMEALELAKNLMEFETDYLRLAVGMLEAQPTQLVNRQPPLVDDSTIFRPGAYDYPDNTAQQFITDFDSPDQNALYFQGSEEDSLQAALESLLLNEGFSQNEEIASEAGHTQPGTAHSPLRGESPFSSIASLPPRVEVEGSVANVDSPRPVIRGETMEDMLNQKLHFAFATILFQEAWMNSSCIYPTTINESLSELHFLPLVVREEFDIKSKGLLNISKFAGRMIDGLIHCHLEDLEVALLDGSLATVIAAGVKVAQLLDSPVTFLKEMIWGLLDTEVARDTVHLLKWSVGSSDSPQLSRLTSLNTSGFENLVKEVKLSLSEYVKFLREKLIVDWEIQNSEVPSNHSLVHINPVFNVGLLGSTTNIQNENKKTTPSPASSLIIPLNHSINSTVNEDEFVTPVAVVDELDQFFSRKPDKGTHQSIIQDSEIVFLPSQNDSLGNPVANSTVPPIFESQFQNLSLGNETLLLDTTRIPLREDEFLNAIRFEPGNTQMSRRTEDPLFQGGASSSVTHSSSELNELAATLSADQIAGSGNDSAGPVKIPVRGVSVIKNATDDPERGILVANDTGNMTIIATSESLYSQVTQSLSEVVGDYGYGNVSAAPDKYEDYHESDYPDHYEDYEYNDYGYKGENEELETSTVVYEESEEDEYGRPKEEENGTAGPFDYGYDNVNEVEYEEIKGDGYRETENYLYEETEGNGHGDRENGLTGDEGSKDNHYGQGGSDEDEDNGYSGLKDNQYGGDDDDDGYEYEGIEEEYVENNYEEYSYKEEAKDDHYGYGDLNDQYGEKPDDKEEANDRYGETNYHEGPDELERDEQEMSENGVNTYDLKPNEDLEGHWREEDTEEKYEYKEEEEEPGSEETKNENYYDVLVSENVLESSSAAFHMLLEEDLPEEYDPIIMSEKNLKQLIFPDLRM